MVAWLKDLPRATLWQDSWDVEAAGQRGPLRAQNGVDVSLRIGTGDVEIEGGGHVPPHFFERVGQAPLDRGRAGASGGELGGLWRVGGVECRTVAAQSSQRREG